MKIELDVKRVVDVEIDGIDMRDYPDFCDAYISKASYKKEDGSFRDLDEDECQFLQEEHSEWFYDKITDKVF